MVREARQRTVDLKVHFVPTIDSKSHMIRQEQCNYRAIEVPRFSYTVLPQRRENIGPQGLCIPSSLQSGFSAFGNPSEV